MPVGVTVPANSTGDESSTSTHFKRKKAQKNVVPGHRSVTRSFRNFDNENHDSSYSGSHNPLYDATTSSENEVVESNPRYVKPYPPDVDLVPFPNNYRQPQFSKFNGTGSLHEHVAHFLAACQDTANNGALLLRQFVQTLSGLAFTWYSKLAPGSIKTWEQMQDSFLERFYSMQRTVGIMELTQTEQRGNEKAADFINRWRNLNLHCPQPITEQEAVRMCMNNLNPDMAVYLQGVRPLTFEELASKATDIENYMQFVTRRSKPYSKQIEKSNPRDKATFKPKQAHAMEATAIIPSLQVGGAATRNNEHKQLYFDICMFHIHLFRGPDWLNNVRSSRIDFPF
uniref:Retrotransposon gag domain-containing protein n=1 Tax=Oryza brachyantha TaxID=4533 RepID=J3MFE1_ORYBR